MKSDRQNKQEKIKVQPIKQKARYTMISEVRGQKSEFTKNLSAFSQKYFFETRAILADVEEKGKAKDKILAHSHQVLSPGFGEENPQTFSIAFSS
jgi:hypothetical protein